MPERFLLDRKVQQNTEKWISEYIWSEMSEFELVQFLLCCKTNGVWFGSCALLPVLLWANHFHSGSVKHHYCLLCLNSGKFEAIRGFLWTFNLCLGLLLWNSPFPILLHAAWSFREIGDVPKSAACQKHCMAIPEVLKMQRKGFAISFFGVFLEYNSKQGLCLSQGQLLFWELAGC